MLTATLPLRRGAPVTAALLAAVAIVAGCSSSASSQGGLTRARQLSLTRAISAEALLTQCAISHGSQAVLNSAQKYNASNAKNQEWLFGNKIELRYHTDSAFTDWWDNADGSATTFGGRQLFDWAQWSDSHRKLPAQVCSTAIAGAALRRLYGQVYAHWPAALAADPW